MLSIVASTTRGAASSKVIVSRPRMHSPWLAHLITRFINIYRSIKHAAACKIVLTGIRYGVAALFAPLILFLVLNGSRGSSNRPSLLSLPSVLTPHQTFFRNPLG
jgi:hypothetical protein